MVLLSFSAYFRGHLFLQPFGRVIMLYIAFQHGSDKIFRDNIQQNTFPCLLGNPLAITLADLIKSKVHNACIIQCLQEVSFGSLTGILVCDQYLKLFYQNSQLTLLWCFQDESEQQKSGHELLILIWWCCTSEGSSLFQCQGVLRGVDELGNAYKQE